MDKMYVKSSPVETAPISPKSFYSGGKCLHKINTTAREDNRLSPVSPSSHKRNRRSPKCSINKGVYHKIRRHKNVHYVPQQMRPLDVTSLLGCLRNEELRNRIETKRAEKQQIEKIHNIFRNSPNPIELAKPLRALNMTNDYNCNEVDVKMRGSFDKYSDVHAMFSDLDCSSDESLFSKVDIDEPLDIPAQFDKNMNTVTETRSETPNENRKFFKSGKTTNIPKQVKITKNIRALVCNGKISLVSKKRKFPSAYPRANLNTADFSNAQATVNTIIKNFDYMDSLKKDATSGNNEEGDILDQTKNNESTSVEFNSETNYETYRMKILSGTNDQSRIDAQNAILNFLIANNMCTESNFNVFIDKPENHREKAVETLKEILCKQKIRNDSIPNNGTLVEYQTDVLSVITNYNYLTKNFESLEISFDDIDTNDGNEIEDASLKSNKQPDVMIQSSDLLSDELNHYTLSDNCDESNTATKQMLFPVFYSGKYRSLNKTTTERSRVWSGGFGSNQYQIDAGQKEFGAKQCKHCGLVYVAHEPEEEKLHREFHLSLQVLRFKGWIDEDRVASFPEWGRDGRIIRITDSAHPKRKERLSSILKIVDKELGFSSYTIPSTFVAYFAIRNCQIVGLCLVQPLQKANKYVCKNGVDYCTIDEFEAKCGISRIWVSPLHRLMNIGKKLVQTVQVNTIIGEEISMDKIAFSAPTADGKYFAQKIVGSESFLVYQ